MPRRQSREQKETVSRVMHEYKHGELRIRGSGPKVKNPKQAIAIGLREAGASNQESPRENKEAFRKTKRKERRGETAEAEAEGKAAQDRTMRRATSRGRSSERSGESKRELYDEARKRGIEGRSRMSKAELKKALER